MLGSTEYSLVALVTHAGSLCTPGYLCLVTAGPTD